MPARVLLPYDSQLYDLADYSISVGTVSTAIVDENLNRMMILFSNLSSDPILVRAGGVTPIFRGILIPPLSGPVILTAREHGPLPGRQWTCISPVSGNILYVGESIWIPGSST